MIEYSHVLPTLHSDMRTGVICTGRSRRLSWAGKPGQALIREEAAGSVCLAARGNELPGVSLLAAWMGTLTHLQTLRKEEKHSAEE